MKPRQIYGLLYALDCDPTDIAREAEASVTEVRMVITNYRGRGPVAQRVRAAIAQRVGRPAAELWPEPVAQATGTEG